MGETPEDPERLQTLLEREEGVYLRVEAEKFYTFARHPGQFTG